MHRPTWVEIDLDALAHNLNSIKNKIGKGTSIIAVVKANAYGHGIEKVSKRLEDEGVSMFGVATVEDAVKLRAYGINNTILILGCILPNQIDTIVKYSITPTIVNYQIAKGISSHILQSYSSADLRKKHRVHIKIDTGMGGFGIKATGAVETIRKINELENISIDGIFTHFTSSDGSDMDTVKEQITLFNGVISALESHNIFIPIKHTDNSSIILKNPLLFNAIRPGISLYGMYASQYLPRLIDLKQVMSLKTKIVNIKGLRKGDTVSYGRTYTAQRETVIATLPIGYSDGYKRQLSNKGNVLVNGKIAKVAGVVRMDFTYIDITDIPGVNVGDEVVLFGSQGDKTISIESIARETESIPYEIICGIGKDVPRIYKPE